MTSTMTEVEASPVFVDQTGRRGRRLRGFGWVFGAAFVGLALAMISGLLGTQSEAPGFAVPDTADTEPPGQYVNAPQPSPPGKANRSADTPTGVAPTPTASASATATETATATAASGATETEIVTATAGATATATATARATATATAASRTAAAEPQETASVPTAVSNPTP